MKIEPLGVPYAGEKFEFTIKGDKKPTSLEAYIDRRQILSTDCPDPPCHEMLIVPQGTRGADLLIVARDADGNSVERVFTVVESGYDAGSKMTLKG